jgi:calcineurin-like phosphoesterase family protein
MSDPSARVRILHISDLHERAERETEPWRRRRVFGDAWDANLDEILQDGPLDLVCFTGDAADRGRPGEFAAAGVFLKTLLVRLRLPSECLFVVPGNHDVDRSINADTWQAIREAAGQISPLALARWLHGLDCPLGFDPDWRGQLFARFAAYRSWVKEVLDRPQLIREDRGSGPHSYRTTVEIRGAKIQIVGLDTAWLCGDRFEAGQLRVSDEQAMRHLTEKGDPLDGFRLVLMHHPFDDLEAADRTALRNCLASHADLVLRGHLHSPESSTWQDPGGELRLLAAGCLYEGHQAEQYPNGCQVVTLDRSKTISVSVRLRSFSPRGGHYFDDGGIYREAPNGQLRFSLIRRAKKLPQAATNPFNPYDPVLPPDFVGRKAELRALESSLLERHGISIVGDWRIGKTSLLRTWQRRAKELGRDVVFLDGQGAEGESVAAFTKKILGKGESTTADAAANDLAAWAADHPPGLAPVLLIDELDGILERFDSRFFDRLRELLGQIVVAVSSRRPVDLIYKDLGMTSPFHNRLEMVQLGLLDEAAAKELSGASPYLSAEAIEMMRKWAGRHPFHLQLLGRHLVKAHLSGEGSHAGLDRYLDEAYSRLREIWSRLNPREQTSLKEAAAGRATTLRSLRRRGLVREDGLPFGDVLTSWIGEET